MTLDLRVRLADELGRGLASLASPVRDLPGFVWMPFAGPCWHCDEPTTWLDVGFETRLHPGACSEAKWDEYAWAEAIARLREMGWLASMDTGNEAGNACDRSNDQ